VSASDRRELRAQKAASIAPSAPEVTEPVRAPALKVVAEPTAEELQQQEWALLELKARAAQQGVTPESLAPKPPAKENWREKLVSQAPAPSPVYAGLYHLTGGSLWTMSGEVAPPDSYIQLRAVDGKHVTDRGIGVRVSSGNIDAT